MLKKRVKNKSLPPLPTEGFLNQRDNDFLEARMCDLEIYLMELARILGDNTNTNTNNNNNNNDNNNSFMLLLQFLELIPNNYE